jgi:hypothetical protein
MLKSLQVPRPCNCAKFVSVEQANSSVYTIIHGISMPLDMFLEQYLHILSTSCVLAQSLYRWDCHNHNTVWLPS